MHFLCKQNVIPQILFRRIHSCISPTDPLNPNTVALLEGLKAGKRQCLSQAITLVESTNATKAMEGRKLMDKVEDHMQQHLNGISSFRIGLSGPPGAGKSTFVEAFGQFLTSQGHRVAVLAVDPSSGTTGGSLLADKTRMPLLTRNPAAYIRPSPNRGHLGGVTRTTNEAVILCECAGYDIVLVETVGVGQSEYLVADMVDMFCLIIPPAGGDELQGLKRGIVEQCDLILVNKCDGDLMPAARRIKSEYTSALKYMRQKSKFWKPKVQMMSSLTGDGIEQVWESMSKYRNVMTDNDTLTTKRAEQRRKWMWSYVQARLMELFTAHPNIKGQTSNLEKSVMEYEISPGNAADLLLEKFVK